MLKIYSFFIERGGLRRKGSAIEFKILVKVKCRADDDEFCGELVPFAGMWARSYELDAKTGKPGKLVSQTCLISEGEARGDPWVGGGPNAGHNLHLDFACEIFYRQEFPYVNRSKPGFEDEEGNETDDLDSATEQAEIKTALTQFDIVLRDEPLATLEKNRYLKYEFESAYLIRDPRPFSTEIIGYRRHITFIYGTRDVLTMTGTRPKGWND